MGARLPDRALHGLQMGLNYLRLGRWMRTRGFDFPVRTANRRACFDVVAERVRDRKVLYLEFGVHKGASMRYWAKALRNPESRLHGFDSFRGLPEDFDPEAGYPKGRFDLGGTPPTVGDPRVEFHVGWFEETLPSFTVPEHEVLVVVIDADLYSSTIFVLRRLRDHLVPESFVYFDELSRLEHEPKAFDEFLRETGFRFRGVAADRSLNNAFFERIA